MLPELSTYCENHFVKNEKGAFDIARRARERKFPVKMIFSRKTAIQYFIEQRNGLGIALMDVANCSFDGLPFEIDNSLKVGEIVIEFFKKT